MKYFVYDHSFEGFLTAVFDVYDHKAEQARIISALRYQPDAFGEKTEVYTDAVKANRVWRGLQKKLSRQALSDVFSCYLSELPEIEDILLSFFRQVFASNEKVEENYGSDAVLRIAQIGRQLFREKHRFEAFVRFQKLQDGTFYAAIDPDYNILPLITSHFVRRYADQNWIIYDTRRKYGIHYDQHTVHEVRFDFQEANKYGDANPVTYEQEEDLYQLLWQVYYKNVNIPARRNMKLHRQHVPIRYWKYLTEKKQR